MAYYKNQNQWLANASDLTPKLVTKIRKPISVVRVVKDANCFQGFGVETIGSLDLVLGVLQPQSTSFVLDFGEHIVGNLQLKIGLNEFAADAPLRLKLIFAEVPSEIGEPFDPYEGQLSRSWLQDEIITLDDLPCEFTTPRRYAFRYLKIEIQKSSPWHQIKFESINCESITSANYNSIAPIHKNAANIWKDLDTVSIRTLANCMQTVFEDGPKRDRRLWVGDLRLQAQANYLTFKNNDLVKRCLYLFAGLANDEGKIMSDLYEKPIVRKGNTYLMDYGALYPVILYDYFVETKDHKTALDLWPTVVRQYNFILQYIDQNGLFDRPASVRIFVDWCEPLHRQASMHAILIYCFKRVIKLANALGEQNEVAPIVALLKKMEIAAHQNFWDAKQKAWVSGPDKQVSWATWAWMVLAEVSTEENAKLSYNTLIQTKNAIKPNGPYLYHHMVEALLTCGLKNEAKQLLKDYWGGMLAKGATTFWEIYAPNEEKLSPYNSYLINSYCHAWSCTPTYFIRKYLSEDLSN
jgi:alpha-L-rhamnosidase